MSVGVELASRGESWGGPVVGLVAAIVFVVFSSWIVLQRVRTHRKDDDA
jgi:hypothetical protein